MRPIVLLGLASLACSERAPRSPDPLPACEWCGAQEAPADLSWTATLAPPGEPGEELVLEGRILAADGETPVAGVLVYAYHTDARGLYPMRGDERGNGRRHGYLRGWVRTDAGGRYRFDTIRPAPYPGRTEPAHVHVTLTPPGGSERWVDPTVFADDPLVDDAYRASMEGRGGPGAVVRLERTASGWRGTRDILLD